MADRSIHPVPASPGGSVAGAATSIHAVIPGEHPHRWRRRWLGVGLVAVVAIAVYANSLENRFIGDDGQLIRRNVGIRDPRNLLTVFVPPIEAPGVSTAGYRPIRHLTYAIDYHLFGLKPLGYHASNIAYHILASTLVLLIATRLLGEGLPALFAALLFAAHPVQTEVVAAVSGRKDELVTIFYLAGFYAFLRYREQPDRRYLIGVALTFLLALLSKESGITLPLSLMAFDTAMGLAFPDGQRGTVVRSWWRSLRASWRRFRLLYSALFLLAAGFGYYVAAYSAASARNALWGGGFGPTILTSARIYLHYITLLLFPATLSATYATAPLVSNSILDPRGLAAVACVVAILYGVIRLARSSRIASFGGLWFFITLLPVSQLVPHHILVADRHLYLPSFGPFLMAGALFARLQERVRIRRFVYASAAILLLILSIRTVVRNRDWRDGLTLWSKTVQTAPQSPRAHAAFGDLLRRRGRLEEAEREFRTALQLDPNEVRGHVGAGALFADRRQWAEAEQALRTAVRLGPTFVHGYLELGRLYQLQGRWTEAEQALSTAIRLAPTFDQALLNLGLVYAAQGRLADAERAVRASLEISPRSGPAHLALGRILIKSGRLEDARTHLERAMRLERESAFVQNTLGVLYMQMSQPEQALESFRSAVRIDPDLAEARTNLARLYLRQGKAPEAEQLLHEGLRRRPTDARLQYELGTLYKVRGARIQAAEALREAVRLDPGLLDARRALEQLHAGGR